MQKTITPLRQWENILDGKVRWANMAGNPNPIYTPKKHKKNKKQ